MDGSRRRRVDAQQLPNSVPSLSFLPFSLASSQAAVEGGGLKIYHRMGLQKLYKGGAGDGAREDDKGAAKRRRDPLRFE